MSEGEEYKWPVELGDHFRAWDFMFKNFEKNLEEKHILRMHKLLMKNLLKNPKQNAGKYRECAIWIGRKGGPKYEQIPELMNSLEYDIINLSKDSNIQDIWNIHHKFETIHPFVDGNGRTGRLLLNWLSLKHLGIFEVVTLEKRTRYYENISQYTSEFKKLNPNVKFYKDASFYSGMPVLDISRIGCWD
jgi:Fic family protein